MALQPAPNEKIDRQTTPPFHLRMYYRRDQFHSPSEFTTVPPPSSLQRSSLIIYTWSDATLAELTNLLLSALLQQTSPEDEESTSLSTAKRSIFPTPVAGTRVAFKLIFPDTRSISSSESRGRWLSKPVGSTIIGSEDEVPEQENGDEDDTSPTTPTGVRMGGDADKTLADARFVIGDYISCAILPPLSDGSVAPLPPAERAADTGRLVPPPRRYGGPPGGGGGSGYGIGYRGENRNGRGYGGDRGVVPAGDWQRGERLPEGRGRDRV